MLYLNFIDIKIIYFIKVLSRIEIGLFIGLVFYSLFLFCLYLF